MQSNSGLLLKARLLTILLGCSCGVKRGSDQKIVGGQAADPGEYPWMVWIVIRRSQNGLGILTF